ncbi:hypothetical protein JSY36_03205 [Bacillus sp. H-16]|uniref:DUF5316 family protein n=1 Tax=Alteribacter salitolerans TaxID=2912333 RepID=UPI001962F2CD|nr:DUF5316 family protein [Alteribacter salitolerans]MBM7094755.1 hypothetical protein [Alteribacter salitolerans]
MKKKVFLSGIVSAVLVQLVAFVMGEARQGYEISGYIGVGLLVLAGLLFATLIATRRDVMHNAAPEDRESQRSMLRIGVYGMLIGLPHFMYAFGYFLFTQ